jgi:predicted DNA-binding transcriptional regulator YafY
VTEEGKGYSLVEGYRIPPIMLTETEANALLTAELLIQSSRDVSLTEAFSSVSAKIKAVVPDSLKRKTELLGQKVGVSNRYTDQSPKSKALLELQMSMLDYQVVKLSYTDISGNTTTRMIEPFAVYANQNNDWVLVAYCRLRRDFRTFSLTGIENLLITGEHFEPHPLTFEQYLEQKYENRKRLNNLS